MAGSYLTFEVDALRQKYAGAGSPYNEFLRRRGMSVGLYVLPAGAEDKQTPHMADEVYVGLEGHGAQGRGARGGRRCGGAAAPATPAARGPDARASLPAKAVVDEKSAAPRPASQGSPTSAAATRNGEASSGRPPANQ